ncbi:MAG: lytic murein transglycosylase [Solirubrobacterales bacterium]|nr:lytic murein transglycosylase [Solirubrobacterales bacterium]
MSSQWIAEPAEDGRRRADPATTLIVGAGGAIALALVLLSTVIAVLGGSTLQLGGQGSAGGVASSASPLAAREIPPATLNLYKRAAQRYGIDWAIVAGIGKVECDHGRDPDPSCSREGAVNYAGAGGPMQFIATTWARYGVDGDGDGHSDRWNPADAITSAAAYLRASGAPGDYRGALLAYNAAGWYVSDVERWAARYRGRSDTAAAVTSGEVSGEGAVAGPSPTPIRFLAGARAALSAGDGHLALIPMAAPLTVQATIVAGNELQSLPYGPAGHPDPRGALEEDCSSTVSYVLYRAGIRPIGEVLRQNPLAQDYVHWGAPGPGRWITIYAADSPSAHVFVVLAGLRLDTSHNGTDVGPNRLEDGPRWRILDHIPTWAHWSIRHPPGL